MCRLPPGLDAPQLMNEIVVGIVVCPAGHDVSRAKSVYAVRCENLSRALKSVGFNSGGNDVDKHGVGVSVDPCFLAYLPLL